MPRRLFTRPFVALATVALAIAVAAQTSPTDTFALRQVFKPGDAFKGRYVAKLDLGIAKIKVTANTKGKVEEVKADGTYVVASQQTDVEVSQDDKVVQTTPETPLAKTTFSANGTALAFDEAALEGQPESFSFEVSRASGFVSPAAPVKKDEQWEVSYAADSSRDVAAGKTKFKVVGFEKVGDVETAVVEMLYTQSDLDDPVTSEGKHWVSLATGESVKSTVTIRNLMTPMGVRAKTAEIVAEVVK